MSVLDSGPEHAIYLDVTYDTIPLGVAIDPIILGGTAGRIVFTNVGGNIQVSLVLDKDGLLGQSPGTLNGETALEGAPAGGNMVSDTLGDYDNFQDIAENNETGDDDERDDDERDDDDDGRVDDDDTAAVPGGCEGCATVGQSTVLNLGNLATLLAASGITAATRRKRRRRAARQAGRNSEAA